MSWQAGTRGTTAGIGGVSTTWVPAALFLAATGAAMVVATPPAGAEELEVQADSYVVETTVIALDAEPHDIVIDGARNRAYVSSIEGDEIISVDLSTLAVVDTHIFPEPAGMDISADGQHLYVALNQSTGIARVDLSNWSSSEVVLPLLDDHRTWDVIEFSPGVVLVSANPHSRGSAYIVKYDFNTATELRVADGTNIRAGPRFAIDDDGFAYVGVGFNPNSLYRLDLSQPLAPIVAEDDHGAVDGTQALAVSPDGSFVVLSSGQKVDAASLVQTGKFNGGYPLFSDDGSSIYSFGATGGGAPIVSVSNAMTTELRAQWHPDCDTEEWSHLGGFVKQAGSPDLLATTDDSICVIHGDTTSSPPPPSPPPPADGGRFFDDDRNIFEGDIEAIATEGVTKGCNPPFGTGFCPSDFVTRGQMAAFLVRAFGYTEDGGGDLFVDDDGSIFEDDLDRLGTAGVTTGCNPPDNDRFCPDDFVTRGQMAAFLVRALGYTDNRYDLFIDDDGSTFENDINRLATAGVTTGCNPPDNTRFCPDDFVTRGQMAAFLTRALDLPRPSVPDRPETTNGFELDVVGAADRSGCSFVDGEVCSIRQSPRGEFFLLTGWFFEDWSALPSSEKAVFESDRIRIEATFDGVPIDPVEWPFEVVSDTGFKSYTFQFPDWLDGDHVLEVRFIHEPFSYVYAIRDTLSLSGGGYPLTTGSLSTTSSTSYSGENQVAPNRSNHWATHD